MAADLGIFIAEKLIETIGSDIIKEVCDVWGYRSHLEELKQTVSTVRKVLLDAEAKGELSYAALDYIEDLKDVVYDADDLFDEVLTLAKLKQLRPHTKSGKLVDKVRRFFSPENQLGQTYRMSGAVKEIKKRLDDIANRHNKFGLSVVDYKPIIRRGEETCSYVEAKDIIGREEDKKAIINMLLDHNADEEICCVTIVGVGGLGKTALAQLVYNDDEVKKMFPDLRIWVCVSDQEGEQFDVKTILCKILEVLRKGKSDDSSTMELVINQLQEQLREKKYLIVLDDVWNEDREKWLELKKFLGMGRGGSKIVVTTRSEITGTIISEENNVYKLKGLSPENAWLLFELSAFNKGHEDENRDEFVAIGREIVKACCNIPLAIKVVGSLLYGQGISKWHLTKESGLGNIGKGDDKSDNRIMSILKLSYHNLTPSLKTCFSYCALFPKDHVLTKKWLINLWMAQGYIMPCDDGRSIEDVAEEHFVILLRRCFFQDVVKDGCGNILFVKIHDLMHDVAQEVSKKEIQIVTSVTDKLGDKVRHVHHVGGNFQESLLLCNNKIRSFYCCNHLARFAVAVTQIHKWKRLRVLDLHESGVVRLPSSIGKLIHLRFLDLSFNYDLELLPDAIARLHNLQTLLLSDCSTLRELPKDFCKLDELRILDLIGCWKLSCMPSGMEKLTSLKMLTLYVVGKKASREAQRDDELKPLKALTGIRGGIRIEIGKYYRNQDEGMDDLGGGGYLKGMKHLAKVEIKFEYKQGGWDNSECERVLKKLEPPLNVKVLTIENYDGTMIPKWGRAVDDWSMFFSNLGEINLQRCRNLQEIPVLRKLRFLKKLDLREFDNLEYMETSRDSQASEEGEIFFPSLKSLGISRLKKLKGWWKGVGDDHRLNTTPFIFPCLSRLEIYGCPELTSFPPCPNLERLTLTPRSEALQITVKTRGKEDDNNNICKLRELHVDNMSHLKLLPIICLRSISIYGEKEADRISKVESVAEAFQRCASSLQHLELMGIKNIRRLCGGSGLEHFTALESLRIHDVIPILRVKDEEDDDKDEDGEDSSLLWKSIPQNLRTLELRHLKEETSLPKGMQYLTSLQHLRLSFCFKLEGVPDWIDCLSSLQFLELYYCRAIKSLPQSIHNLTSLQTLGIMGCPDLKQRCEKPSGEDYPKIQHIPKILLEYIP